MAVTTFDLDKARDLRRELKIEWAEMWRSKLDDKEKAESMSNSDFKWLFVDQGQILFASRDFKALSFREVMERYMSTDIVGKISPDPSIGGWRRFAREKFSKQKSLLKPSKTILQPDKRQQQKNKGRGWRNFKGLSL